MITTESHVWATFSSHSVNFITVLPPQPRIPAVLSAGRPCGCKCHRFCFAFQDVHFWERLSLLILPNGDVIPSANICNYHLGFPLQSRKQTRRIVWIRLQNERWMTKCFWCARSSGISSAGCLSWRERLLKAWRRRRWEPQMTTLIRQLIRKRASVTCMNSSTYICSLHFLPPPSISLLPSPLLQNCKSSHVLLYRRGLR